MNAGARGRAAFLAPLLLGLVVLLPNPGAAIPRLTYYFRDFSLTYYPLRAFFSRQAAAGHFPFWNPLIHEGCPFLPVFYPPELLQALWPGPAAVSWLLTLHLPIGALAMYGLARELGADRAGAFVAGAAYAMGGLSVSSLNLHWFLEALALAPLVALTTRRAAVRGGRTIPLAALILALSISTLAVEFVAQAVLVGVALGLEASPARAGWARLACVLALGIGLAALPIALMVGILGGSLRGAGFPPGVALSNPAHPLALLQTVVPDLFGSVAEPLRYWWSGRLFDLGAPYFMSVYLGPLALASAAVGGPALSPRVRRILLALALVGLWYALGRPGGLAAVLAPALKWFRYPCKALLLPHLVAALLAGMGVTRLRGGSGWGRLAAAAGLGAVALAALGAGVVQAAPRLAERLDISPASTAAMLRTVPAEAAEAAVLLALGCAVAVAVRAARLPPATAAGWLAALIVAQLWRAGWGVNPQVSPAFFGLLPGLAAERLDALNGGRVFSYGIEQSPAFMSFTAARPPGVDAWSFFLDRQMLDPYNNVIDGVESAGGGDRLSLVPNPPALAPGDYDPRRVAGLLDRLRSGAVVRVLSLDPLVHPDLLLRATVRAGPPGIRIRVYELLGSWPRDYVACRTLTVGSAAEAHARSLGPGFDPRRDVALESPGLASCTGGALLRWARTARDANYEVEADGNGYLVMRDSYAKGWSASLDGRPAPVLRANGRHRAVEVPAGRHRVELRYTPPGLGPGTLVTVLAALLGAVIAARPVLRARPEIPCEERSRIPREPGRSGSVL